MPGLDDPLIEFGLDSLSVVEIAEKIMLCSNCKIPQTFIYNYPTIRAIVSYFENEKIYYESNCTSVKRCGLCGERKKLQR